MTASAPPPNQRSSLPPSRSSGVISVVAVAVAAAGFFTGTRDAKVGPPAPAPSARLQSTEVTPGARAVPAYRDLRGGDFRSNAGIYATAADDLVRGLPDPLAAVELTNEERARAVAERTTKRAYDGAPPTIPHAVGQLEPTGCLVCHERGANVAGRIAPAISHPRYAACVQCHVVSNAPGPAPAGDAGPANAFVGHAWGKGERAWPGAPPTTPHPTGMRGECTSCHGPSGKLGLRSSHPWRTSCEQCHAPSASLDQRAPATIEARP